MFTILIVEDNQFFCEALYGALQSHFRFAVLATAGNVRDAFAKAHSMRPDLIFVNVSLPDGTGLELTRRLRAAGIDASIAVLTSHDLPEYREEALRSGADHFMAKGCTSISEIFGVVQSALASRFEPATMVNSLPDPAPAA